MINLAVFLAVISSAAIGAAPPDPAPSSPVKVVITEDEARLELSRMLRDDKRLAEAISEYRKLIEKSPRRSDLRLELAEIYAGLGDPASAADILQPVDPETLDDDGRKLVANVDVQLKHYAPAIHIFRGLLEKNPEDQNLRYQLAEVLSWAQRYDESIAEFQILLKGRKDDAQLRRQYARVLGWAGRHAEAIEQWRLSLENAKSAG